MTSPHHPQKKRDVTCLVTPNVMSPCRSENMFKEHPSMAHVFEFVLRFAQISVMTNFFNATFCFTFTSHVHCGLCPLPREELWWNPVIVGVCTVNKTKHGMCQTRNRIHNLSWVLVMTLKSTVMVNDITILMSSLSTVVELSKGEVGGWPRNFISWVYILTKIVGFEGWG